MKKLISIAFILTLFLGTLLTPALSRALGTPPPPPPYPSNNQANGFFMTGQALIARASCVDSCKIRQAFCITNSMDEGIDLDNLTVYDVQDYEETKKNCLTIRIACQSQCANREMIDQDAFSDF